MEQREQKLIPTVLAIAASKQPMFEMFIKYAPCKPSITERYVVLCTGSSQ
jgi:hypothetical protein